MNTHEAPIQLSMPLTPWAQLVTPILVARTVARRAQPIVEKFLKAFPTAQSYMQVLAGNGALFILQVDEIFRPLGLSTVRTAAVGRVAVELTNAVAWVPDRAAVLAIPGCGRYVADSFDLFYRGNLDCEPIDPVLIAYRDATLRRFAEASAARFVAAIEYGLAGAERQTRCPECEDDDGGAEFGLALDPDRRPR